MVAEAAGAAAAVVDDKWSCRQTCQLFIVFAFAEPQDCQEDIKTQKVPTFIFIKGVKSRLVFFFTV
jgi:hypothetical protein